MSKKPVDTRAKMVHIGCMETQTGVNEMAARYALRMETADGTLEAAYHHLNRKDDAIRAARKAAKETICPDVVRFWVDDDATGLGIASFATQYGVER